MTALALAVAFEKQGVASTTGDRGRRQPGIADLALAHSREAVTISERCAHKVGSFRTARAEETTWR